MTMLSRLRALIVLFLLIAASGAQGVSAAPQPAPGDAALAQEGFPLPAFTAYCDPGYLGPFEGCTPWEGVTVSFVSDDASFSTSCVTAAGVNVASCSVTVPFGSTITASIDPSIIGAAYFLEGSASLTYEIPEGPPEGEFGGPAFVLFPIDDGPAPEAFPFPVAASICDDAVAPGDDCVPWEGAVVTVTSSDGTFSDSCLTATFIEYAAGCEVSVPFGSRVTASISEDQIPAGYELYAFDPTWDIPPGVPGGITGQPVFWLVPVEAPNLTTLPVYASICTDALPPNDDCQPWEGITVSAETPGGTYNATCVTATFFETVAGCNIKVPRGTEVTAYISEEQIPAGYELFVEVPTWDIPEEGELESGPYFFLVKSDDGGNPTKTPTQTPAAPVKQLPSTGAGDESGTVPAPGDGTIAAVIAGAGLLTLLGGGIAVRRNR